MIFSKHASPSTPDRRRFLQNFAWTAAGLKMTAATAPRASPLEADVCVFDSTPAGIVAAVAAAGTGAEVVLVTEDEHVGGMQSGGLGNTNAGQRATVGGLAREFYRRVRQYYLTRYGPDSEQFRDCDDGFHFEPQVAERLYSEWLSEAGIRLITSDGIDKVEKSGNRLQSLRLQSGRTVRARIFIDASYEGDLLKWAGCTYHVGREDSEQYGESLAGRRFPPSELGRGDKAVQAFDYRLCLTDDPDNRVDFPEPRHYRCRLHNHYLTRMTAEPPDRLHRVLPLNRMPNRKTDSRTGEWVGGSWRYPEADREERGRIAQAHREYSIGYLWFLQHDAPLPDAVREELKRWGLAKDEFTDNENWPYHLYVREARRLAGDYVMTEKDVVRDRFQPDSVALGSFFLDVHAVRIVSGALDDFLECPDLDRRTTVFATVPEGGIRTSVRPYEIPYRTLLPRRSEAENLLVPVCLSSSHVAFSTLRMEPVYQMLGHACGAAAALSLGREVPLHELPVKTLQEILTEQGQIIDARPFKEFWP